MRKEGDENHARGSHYSLSCCLRRWRREWNICDNDGNPSYALPKDYLESMVVRSYRKKTFELQTMFLFLRGFLSSPCDWFCLESG